ncbi:MAG: TrmH family RNA methyltransferase [Candidatus Flexifilum sp.]
MGRGQSARIVTTMAAETYLEGAISVEAALRAVSRPIHALIVRAGAHDPELMRLRRLAADQGIPVEQVSPEAIAALAQGRTHGGVLARVGERRMVALDDLIAGSADPWVVMLDGVEDPFNFGQAVRALYAAGAAGLVVRPRSWLSAAGVVARASAGASEWMPTAVAETAQQAADWFRQRGIPTAVTDHRRAVSIYEVDLTGPLFLVIGGEKRGVTRSFADAADLRLRIPYGRPFGQALDTTSAAAALAFEIMRQRQTKQTGRP